MRLIEFFPGEGSRYLVGADRIPATDAAFIGGTEKAVVLTIGNEHRLASFLCECDAALHPVLEAEKVIERLGLDPATHLAALHIFACILGREPMGASWTPAHLGWHQRWKVYLDPLRWHLGLPGQQGRMPVSAIEEQTFRDAEEVMARACT